MINITGLLKNNASLCISVAVTGITVFLQFYLFKNFIPGRYDPFGPAKILYESINYYGFWLIAVFVILFSALFNVNLRRGVIHIFGVLREKYTFFLALLFILINYYFLHSDWGMLDLALAGAVMRVSFSKCKKSGERILGDFFLIFASCYFYSVVKSLIFVFLPPCDQLILNIEQNILGFDVYAEILQFIPMWVFSWMTKIYFFLFQAIFLVYLILRIADDADGIRVYVVGLSVVYCVGVALYFILPSYGPAFYLPLFREHIAKNAVDSFLIQRFLWVNTQAVIDGKARIIYSFGYIAAMPSLHLAQAVLLALVVRKYMVLNVVAVMFSLLTALSCVILGWHYISDIIIGIVFGVISYFTAQAFIASSGRGDA